MSMGVYIKDMEIPKNCDVCPFCDYASARCDAVKGTPYTPESRYEKRADFCPLVEVPPHGRLIDADALVKKQPIPELGAPRWLIEQAPTIIESEEKDDK